MTQYPDLFAALAQPFEPQEIRTRSQAGRQLSYITARTAMNRLDDVMGPENWWDDYIPGERSVMCRLTLRLPDGSTITKVDAGGYAGMADEGDDDKSGFSDGFKRACAKFGIARYLYRDGVPNFVRDREAEAARAERFNADGAGITVTPPPEPARKTARQVREDNPSVTTAAELPEPERDARKNGHVKTNGHANGHARESTPRSGRALFAWVKDQEQKHEVGLLKYLNSWGRLQEFPGRMVEWDDNQVALGHAEAIRKLQAIGTDAGLDEALAN